jgi:hypothetical protein
VSQRRSEETTTVRILNGSEIRGKRYRAGDVATFPEALAAALIRAGTAAPPDETGAAIERRRGSDPLWKRGMRVAALEGEPGGPARPAEGTGDDRGQ